MRPPRRASGRPDRLTHYQCASRPVWPLASTARPPRSRIP